MPYFAVYRVSDGELVSEGSVVADDATLQAKGLARKEVADLRTNPGRRWDPVALDWIVPAPLPVAVVSTFDPTDPATKKTTFAAGTTIGIRVEIQDGAGNIVTGFAGPFAVPISRLHPHNGSVLDPEAETVGVEFVNGVAEGSFPGFGQAGTYGVHAKTSELAQVIPHSVRVVRNLDPLA